VKEIITYQESPIPIPHPDAAWVDMRDRLRDSEPAPAPEPLSIPAKAASGRLPIARIAATATLLLLAALYPLRLLMPTGSHSSSASYHQTQPVIAAIPSGPHPASAPSTKSASSASTTPPSSATANTPDLANSKYGEIAPIKPISPTDAPSSPFDPHFPTAAPPPPASKLESTVIHPEPQYLTLQLGLQWTAQVPTDNPHTYLDGANGHTSLYRPLLPAAWMHLQWDRSLLEFTLDPFYSNLVPLKPYSRQQRFDTISNTALNIFQSQSLSKLFGLAGGIGYSANISGKWWAGGGFQTIWWTGAIVSTYTLEIEQPVGATWVQPKLVNINSTSTLSKPDWQYFSTFQLDLYAQLLYKTPGGHAGFRVGFPFTVLSRDQGPTAPLRLEFFYRLQLLTRQVRGADAPE